jgi:hypothetical protein
LGEAIDYARQGEVAALKFTSAPLSRVDPDCTNFEGANREQDDSSMASSSAVEGTLDTTNGVEDTSEIKVM